MSIVGTRLPSQFNGVPGELGSTNWAPPQPLKATSSRQEKLHDHRRAITKSNLIAEIVDASEYQAAFLQTHIVNNYIKTISDLLKQSAGAGRWSKIRAIAKRWGELEEDWDGEEAPRPAKVQMEAVNLFIERAEFAGVREPRAYLSSDTEMGFHWDGVEKASVSFLYNERFLAYCPVEGGDPIRISGPLDIAAASSRFFEALAKHR